MAILCATDLSPRAAEAAQAAAILASRLKIPLELIHVVDAPYVEEIDPKATPAMSQFADRLHRVAESLAPHRATIRETLLQGVPDEAILDHAAKSEAQILVLAATGRRSETRWPLGTTAERIAQSARMPVLVVRQNGGFLNWTSRPLKVLIGTDFTPTSDAAISWVRRLREAGPVDVIAMHVYDPVEQQKKYGLAIGASPAMSGREIKNLIERDLTERLGSLGGEGSLRTVAQPAMGRVADQLVAWAIEEQADLLVVGTHQRKGLSRLWHGSVSQSVLHQAPMSVACVPVPASFARSEVADLNSVLVPTDFSDFSTRAIPFAYGIVSNHVGALVHLLHVIEPVTAPNPLYSHYRPGRIPTPEERDRQRQELLTRLRSLIPKEGARRGIQTNVHVVESRDVSEAIAQAAERFAVDMICLASHGRSGISKVFLGSVAHSVLNRCTRPVLLVPATGA